MHAPASAVYEELLLIKRLNFSKFGFLQIVATQILHLEVLFQSQGLFVANLPPNPQLLCGKVIAEPKVTIWIGELSCLKVRL